MPRHNGYWVLPVGGYSDTQADYVRCDTRAEVNDSVATTYWGDGMGGAFVYHGSRTPWTEQDPYPDWSVERGPRGGIRWQRA